MKREVTVVVPVYAEENPARVARVAECLLKGTHTPKEILLVVNGSGSSLAWDVARELGSSQREVRAIRVDQPGVVNARNTGLSEARTKYTVFCDVDNEPGKEWIDCLVRGMEQSEKEQKTIIVSGPVVFLGKSEEENRRFKKKQLFLVKILSMIVNGRGKKRSAFVTEGGFIAHSDRLRGIGGFNVELEGCFGEGAEVSARALRGGYAVQYDPSIELSTSPRRIGNVVRQYMHAMILLTNYMGHALVKNYKICLIFSPVKEGAQDL